MLMFQHDTHFNDRAMLILGSKKGMMVLYKCCQDEGIFTFVVLVSFMYLCKKVCEYRQLCIKFDTKLFSKYAYSCLS